MDRKMRSARVGVNVVKYIGPDKCLPRSTISVIKLSINVLFSSEQI